VRSRHLKKLQLIALSLGLILSLSACAKDSAPTALRANVVLLDISGSSTDSKGTYNEENHSPSSLSERRRQLEASIKNAIRTNTAVYFGFVRYGYGVTDISTLVPPSLILDIEDVLNSDINNEKLRNETKDGISKAWQAAINQETSSPNSCDEQPIVNIITSESNAAVSDENAKRIAGKLCSGAINGVYQFEQLKGEPKDIGSDIQAAVDRSLQKLASDQKRLINSDGKSVALIPTMIVVSDLIQMTNGVSKAREVSAVGDLNQACELARNESKNFSPSFLESVSLISDGFAGTKNEVNSSERDKLKKYWECWFGTRNINDLDIGAKGIDLGAL
jgi:hypothetical protein